MSTVWYATTAVTKLYVFEQFCYNLVFYKSNLHPHPSIRPPQICHLFCFCYPNQITTRTFFLADQNCQQNFRYRNWENHPKPNEEGGDSAFGNYYMNVNDSSSHSFICTHAWAMRCSISMLWWCVCCLKLLNTVLF